jgi:flagellar biosynthesis protein FlhF
VECFVEQAYSYNECLSKIAAKYGEKFITLSQRKIRYGGFLGLFTREGVEVTFYIPSFFNKNYNTYPRDTKPATQKEQGFPREPGSLREPLDFEREKEKVIAAAGRETGKDPTLQLVLSEMRSIKEKIDAKAVGAGEREHPNLKKIAGILDLNDFSHAFSGRILERAHKDFSLEDLGNFDTVQDRVLEWIGESLTIYKEAPVLRKPRVFVLVGPTGVGKTTTIAKLAAAYGVDGWGRSPLSVRMITIDGYRIAAREQIEKYGDIMGIPVSYVSTQEEMRKAVALYSENVDLILVDTIGKSPRDTLKLGEMKQFIDACGSQKEVHLAVAATTKYSDIREIMQQFAPFDYQSVVVTKLDETIRTGNVISVLSDNGKAVSYITDGQPVHQYIHKADVIRFLVNLEGFQVNRSKLEARFNGENA